MEMQLSNEGDASSADVSQAREEFHLALVASHRTRSNVGEVEAAAARFCRALRAQGMTPERTLIDAKQVIELAIDGSDIPMAERAVLSCIQHYFRD
jgi:hypothetical protein